MGSTVLNKLRAKNGIVRRFQKNEDGSTAIEFVLLALPFSALLFAILETAIVFFITSTMTHAVSEASRTIRTGTFQQGCADDEDAFKAAVCNGMAQIGNCSQRLRIDVVKSSTNQFQMSLLPQLPQEDGSNSNDESPIPASTYTNTGARDVVIVRAQYFHKLALPGKLTFLANRNGNVRLLQTTTAFKNEPFPNSC